MTIAESLTKLSTDLSAAYDAVAAKGGTVPTEKNTNNLSTAISSITGGGGDDDPYVVPEFDGGLYGAIAYLDDDGQVQYYTAPNSGSLLLTGSSQPQDTIATLPGGERIRRGQLLAYSFGSNVLTSPPSYFCVNMTNLRRLYGLETRMWSSIGSHFLQSCFNFNQPLTLPASVTSISANFMQACYSFNQPISLPSGLKSINNYFLAYCYSFNQPVTLPTGLTTVGTNFLGYNYTFNKSIDLPSTLQTIGASFLCQNYNFNRGLTLPDGLTSISNEFLYGCDLFNQPLTLPATLASVGTSFMYRCNNYTSILTLNTEAHPTDNNTLSANGNTAPMYVTGVTLAGPYAQVWKDALPDHSYRKLIVATE